MLRKSRQGAHFEKKNCIHKHTHKHCFPKIHFIIILSFKISPSKWHCYCTFRPNIRARFIYTMHAIYLVHLLLSIKFPDNIEGRTQIEQPLFKLFLMLQPVQRTDVRIGSQGQRVTTHLTTACRVAPTVGRRWYPQQPTGRSLGARSRINIRDLWTCSWGTWLAAPTIVGRIVCDCRYNSHRGDVWVRSKDTSGGSHISCRIDCVTAMVMVMMMMVVMQVVMQVATDST